MTSDVVVEAVAEQPQLLKRPGLARRLARRHRRWVIIASLLCVAAAAEVAVRPLFVVRIVELGVAARDTEPVVPWIAILVTLVVIGAVVEFARRRAVGRLGEDVLAELRTALFSKMLTSSPQQRSGFLARATNDVSTVAWQVGAVWPTIIGALFTAVASAVALFLVDVRLAAVVLGWCLLLLLPLIRWYRRRAAVEVALFFTNYEVWAGVFEELTDGAPTARRFGRTDIAGRFDEPNVNESVAFANTQITMGRLIAVIALLRGGTIALVLLIAPQLTSGAAQLAVIAGFVAALPGLFGSLNELARKFGYVQLGVVALARLATLEPAPTTTTTMPRSRPAQNAAAQSPTAQTPTAQTPAAQTLTAQTLTAHGLSQHYPHSGFTLGPVDLVMAAGSRTALVGPTGAGKSTLGRLLAGLEAPAAGSVTLGDRTLPPVVDAFAGNPVIMLPQEHHLFPGTVADNLRLARPDATDADLLAALDSLGLRSWAEGLPEGISTAVDGHRHISDGERQLIALGQVVLLDPSVVILDEPTSALDPATSRALERAATRALAGRTIILVTHRLASAATCDEIVVLEGGQVSERGDHTKLLAGAGLYARLWTAADHSDSQTHD